MTAPDSTQRISSPREEAARPVEVIVEEAQRSQRKRFTTRFLIGRGSECHVVVSDESVSRLHAEVVVDGGRWWVRDLQSTNGTYVAGECIERRSLGAGKTKIRLGPEGPVVSLEVLEADRSGSTVLSSLRSVPVHIRRMAGLREDRATLVHRVVKSALHKQSRKYFLVIAALGVFGLIAAVYAAFNYAKLEKQRELAENVFYEIKELELAYARLETQLQVAQDTVASAGSEAYLEQRDRLLESYEQYVSELGIYSEDMSPQERVIYRVARIFGECEIGIPEGFTGEVLRYVEEWKKSPKLRRALERARSKGYFPIIRKAMLEEHLPPQFLYLCLQESEFDSTACGPRTRFGIAKGMWQFIPATAIQYGLRTGPLVDLPRRDPKDQRHNVALSTRAAARYLRDIYNTEAQASGLLVIAAYNWGHNAVRGLIRKLPENPRERNFWKFLQRYRSRLPRETYDYVFYIISAAVIGERPDLFGFDIPTPLNESGPGS